MNLQADLNLSWAQMSEGMFSDMPVQINLHKTMSSTKVSDTQGYDGIFFFFFFLILADMTTQLKTSFRKIFYLISLLWLSVLWVRIRSTLA